MSDKKSQIHPAVACANQSYKVGMTDKIVVDAILNMRLPEEWEFHFYDFFTDNPAPMILKFCRDYGIPLEKLKEFYERFIKHAYRNRQLEEVWRVE